MSIHIMKNHLTKLMCNERGSAMTEFVMFLPVWVIIFIAIGDLTKLGVYSTEVQVTAQKNLWSSVAALQQSGNSSNMFPLDAAASSQGIVREARGMQSTHSGANVVDSIVMIALGVNGHMAESAARIAPALIIPNSPIKTDDLKIMVTDIDAVDAASNLPKTMLNDGVLGAVNDLAGGGGFKGYSSVVGMLTSLVAGSGIITAQGAGIRYGVFKGETSMRTIALSQFSVTTGARYDALVPPSPLTGGSSRNLPFALGRLIAEGSGNNYAKLMNFGDVELEGNGSNWSDSSGRGARANDNGEDEIKEQREQSQEEIDEETKRRKECLADPDCTPDWT